MVRHFENRQLAEQNFATSDWKQMPSGRYVSSDGFVIAMIHPKRGTDVVQVSYTPVDPDR